METVKDNVNMQATYFFSFRSPYSWLASIGLKKKIEAGDTFELVPFWEPDAISRQQLESRSGEFPYRKMSEAKHRYILRDIKRLADKFNLEVKWPLDSSPWWELSHLGYLRAKELGVGLPFFWRVYQARWQEGLDISTPEVIKQVCLDIGMTEELAKDVSNAPQNESIRELGGHILYRIYREDIFGVPMFTRKRLQFWGLDRLNDFLGMIGTAPLSTEELPLARGYPLDFDHAGGCG